MDETKTATNTTTGERRSTKRRYRKSQRCVFRRTVSVLTTQEILKEFLIELFDINEDSETTQENFHTNRAGFRQKTVKLGVRMMKSEVYITTAH